MALFPLNGIIFLLSKLRFLYIFVILFIYKRFHRFFSRLYNKTAGKDPVRKKIFDCLSEHINIDCSKLLTYTGTLARDLKLQKQSSLSTATAIPSSTSSVSVSSSSKNESSLLTNNQKTSSLTSQSNSNNALNLSKNHSAGTQNAGFGEGLASKLQADRNQKSSSVNI